MRPTTYLCHAQNGGLIRRTLGAADKPPSLTGRPNSSYANKYINVIKEHCCQLRSRATPQSCSEPVIHSFIQDPSRSILGQTERRERANLLLGFKHIFHPDYCCSILFKKGKKKSISPSSFGCSILMKIQFASLFSFLPPQFMHFHPLKVISDLWVSFPGRMIAVFYGGGERSRAPHQG